MMAEVEFSRKQNSGNGLRHWWRLGVAIGPSGSAASRLSTEPDIPVVRLSIKRTQKRSSTLVISNSDFAYHKPFAIQKEIQSDTWPKMG